MERTLNLRGAGAGRQGRYSTVQEQVQVQVRAQQLPGY